MACILVNAPAREAWFKGYLRLSEPAGETPARPMTTTAPVTLAVEPARGILIADWTLPKREDDALASLRQFLPPTAIVVEERSACTTDVPLVSGMLDGGCKGGSSTFYLHHMHLHWRHIRYP
jgi:hypothetical protein